MSLATSRAYVVGTCDTKGEELAYVRDLLRRAEVPTLLVDVAVKEHPSREADITSMEVASHHPEGINAVHRQRDRGRAVSAMGTALRRFVAGRSDIAGMIGLGGSGGTAIVAPAMRSVPVGTPKILISAMASGNVAPHVGSIDMCLLYPVTDLLGINSISSQVLANGAHALAGMIQRRLPPTEAGKVAVGFTMFGVTTPAVGQVVASLRSRYDCLVFHATAGIQNYPTVGRVDGALRAALEQTGLSYAQEVEVIGLAHRADLLTTPYVFSAADAMAMARAGAGADIIVCHLGLTAGGATGASSPLTLDQCATMIDEWAAAALDVRPDLLVLCHGGPISMPEDVARVLGACRHCHGFYGASSMERLPVEKAPWSAP